jgi:hypothetical protein
MSTTTQRHVSALLLFTLAVLLSSFAAGQTMSPAERQRILAQQDAKSAGASGDKSFVPYLKDLIQVRKQDKNEWDDVQMALAKLGEREQQQQIVCVFYRGDKYEADRAGSRQLRYIGGWFAIRLYMEMLANKQIWSHWAKAKPQGITDEAIPSPSDMALNELPKLVPGLPPLDQKNWKASQSLCPEYIRKHEAELSSLLPTGKGVDLSGKTCNGKPRERSINE